MYTATQNPVYAWQAFLLCSGKDIPDWVRLFLQDQACAVIRLANNRDIEDGKKNERLPEELGFSTMGSGNAFSSYSKDKTRADATVAYERLITDGTKPYLAREEIARQLELRSSISVKNFVDDTTKNWDIQQTIIGKSKSKKRWSNRNPIS